VLGVQARPELLVLAPGIGCRAVPAVRVTGGWYQRVGGPGRDGVPGGTAAVWPGLLRWKGGDPHVLVHRFEGSTALLGRLGEEVYARVLAGHHAIIRSGLAAHGGREVDTQGDAFFAVFGSPAGCVAAVIQLQRALADHAWPAGEQVRVRMGVHTGEASATATGLVGLDVHRAARVAAAGYGGQVLVSAASAALVGGGLPPGAALVDLGVHRLKDLQDPVRIFQLQAEGLPAGFPPLRTVPGGRRRRPGRCPGAWPRSPGGTGSWPTWPRRRRARAG
jgi:class 3 adenylate cyclase